jgi:predicted HTH transcriptional regulator
MLLRNDVAMMRLGAHVPRTPIVLSHFAKLGYVTSLGTGVPRVIRLVLQALGKEPDIVIRDFEVMVSIPRQTMVK